MVVFPVDDFVTAHARAACDWQSEDEERACFAVGDGWAPEAWVAGALVRVPNVSERR